MKSVKQLMSELGFKPGANEDVAKAFLKNLNNAINESKRPEPMKPRQDLRLKKSAPEQLSFDFSDSRSAEKIKKSS